MGKPATNEIGNTYGHLEVFAWGKSARNGRHWWCYCHRCGTFTQYLGGDLRRGGIVSCGCYLRDVRGKEAKVELQKGDVFGRLTVVKESPVRTSGLVHWVCTCVCKTNVTVSGVRLRRGGTRSCGCLQRDIMKSKTGKNNPNYLHDQAHRDALVKVRTGGEYRAFKDAVLMRDNHTCQVTGETDCDMDVHHRLSFNEYPALRLVVMNGITMSSEVHREFHSKYGKITTIRDFLDFVENKVITLT